MGGEFDESEGRVYYLGGLEPVEVVVDIDKISWFFFEEYVRFLKLGTNIKELWYKKLTKSLDNRRVVREEFRDIDLENMICFARECGELDVYVEHQLSQPVCGDTLVDVNVEEELPRDMNVDAEESRDQIYVGDLGGYNSDEDVDFAVDSSSDGRISDDDDSCLGDTLGSSDDDFVEEIPVRVGLESDVVVDEVDDDVSTDEYLDSDCYIPLTPEGSDEECQEVDQPRRKPVAFPSDDLLHLGKTFNSRDEFKRALLDYALKKHFNVKMDRWERTKVGAKCCTKGCPWRVYCSVEVPINKWMVKIYKDGHNHDSDTYINLFTMRQIAKEYAERFRREPDWKAEKLQIAILEDHDVNVPISKCFKARRMALKMVMEDPSVQIAKLWDYELELRRSNLNTTTEVTTKIVKTGTQVFHSFYYVSFEFLRDTWKNHCRPVIGLDGCFLKWEMKGELLAAVGRDANNGMYPIAWAVVRVESIESWNWFIRKLKLDLGLGDGRNLTILSDRQKGLLNAVQKELPLAEHRMCTRHVFANWKKQFKDLKRIIDYDVLV
ncbi:PREDICTED: uncharacterized protein LOC104802582 isoform X2 [Tarenaya hassleriana]|uniref:uncharacterized protein LOC104802582 isoform X2 n=1 Tax=Tarenaya hassleriana TaxID=28532 RepID=UPI00053C4226|nr:PREDICTED: uncharacterized protein LOC104802582 isoform X2 [Tarenaya hassleriana]